MVLTDEQKIAFEKAAEPLVKFLCDNFHPHVVVIVEPNGAEIFEGSMRLKIEKYIKD